MYRENRRNRHHDKKKTRSRDERDERDEEDEPPAFKPEQPPVSRSPHCCVNIS